MRRFHLDFAIFRLGYVNVDNVEVSAFGMPTGRDFNAMARVICALFGELRVSVLFVRDVDLLAGNEFKQCSLAVAGGLNAALKRGCNVVRIGNPFAIATKGFRHICVMSGNFDSTILLLGNGHDRNLNRHGKVVK